MDEHWRFPEVEIIRSPSTSVIIEKLKKIFSIHGFPIEFVSDNGPPFQGHDFQNYLATNGIKITPYWPQANSHVERFMRTIEKSVRIAHSQGKNWKHDLYRFLLDYLTTLHATTEKAPADLLPFQKRIEWMQREEVRAINQMRYQNREVARPYFNEMLSKRVR